jgi:hypothetical protein
MPSLCLGVALVYSAEPLSLGTKGIEYCTAEFITKILAFLMHFHQYSIHAALEFVLLSLL